jgi:hypothetical protein
MIDAIWVLDWFDMLVLPVQRLAQNTTVKS